MQKRVVGNTSEFGAVSGWLIASIVLGVLVVILGAVAIWSLVNYNEARTDVDGQIEVAVSEARRQQAEEDEARFAEREKEPYARFVGPDSLGRVEFDYPKTWSVHVARGEEGRRYEAYLHPNVVPPVDSSAQFALRVIIEGRPYEDVLRSYERRVERGDLRSEAITVSGFNGTRLDGNFEGDKEGSMVIFKVRDKTLTVVTDATAFRPDFNNIVLPSLTFNP